MRQPISHVQRAESLVVARASASALLALCLTACGTQVRCEPGLCPSGTTCEPDTGRCVALDSATDGAGTRLFGAFSVVQLPGLRQGFVGHAPEHQSLAWVEHDNKQPLTMFIAGPAAESKQPAAGEISAATAAPDGHVHVAFVRVKDGTLWYAHRKQVSWLVEQVKAAPTGTVGDRVDIALWQGRPAIVYRDLSEHRLHVLLRAADGQWMAEKVPAPASLAGKNPDLGGALSISPWGDVVFVITYDATEGDLVLAVRKDGIWSSTRQAAAPSEGGVDGDIGSPSAVARSLVGDLVIAYRDRDRNQVRLLRTESGKSVDRLVSDGAYQSGQNLQQRRHLVGTALSVVTLASGRVAIAYLNASQMRIHVAIQGGDGGFSIVDVPHQGRPQAWPRLLSQVDGTLLVAYLELDPPPMPPAGRVLTWTLPVAAVQP